MGDRGAQARLLVAGGRNKEVALNREELSYLAIVVFSCFLRGAPVQLTLPAQADRNEGAGLGCPLASLP